MPRRAESFGPWMETGWPSQRISPSSMGWMPAIDLIIVDLPAPLSPTSAMTSPASTWKSTPLSAVTAPKRLKTPFSSSRACPLTTVLSSGLREGASCAPSQLPVVRLDPCAAAEGCVLPDADVAALEEAVLDDRVLDVGLGHRDRGQQDRRGLRTLVVDRAVGLRGLALRQRNRERRGRVGLLLDGLVDRHALLTREDVLDALRRRVLAGD